MYDHAPLIKERKEKSNELTGREIKALSVIGFLIAIFLIFII